VFRLAKTAFRQRQLVVFKYTESADFFVQ